MQIKIGCNTRVIYGYINQTPAEYSNNHLFSQSTSPVKQNFDMILSVGVFLSSA